MSRDPLDDLEFEAELERLADRAAGAVIERARARRRAQLERELSDLAADVEPTVVDFDQERTRRRPL